MKNYLRTIYVFILLFLHAPVFGQLTNSYNNSKINTEAQPVKLSIVKNSDESHTSPEHIYLLGVENKTDKPVSLKVEVNNANCGILNTSPLKQIVYWKDSEFNETLSDKSTVVTVKANSTVEFYVKLIKSFDSKLNTWNCTEIKVLDSGNRELSERLLIESFLPDPQDFR